jgi:hypothetical protein
LALLKTPISGEGELGIAQDQWRFVLVVSAGSRWPSPERATGRYPTAMTESDTIRQNDGETRLTTRQARFLPVLLASPTCTHACKAGRVSRDTLYERLKDPTFKAELGRQRHP